MKTNKGFTLIEVAVVLAAIAILAAILTPIVTSYIDQARLTRANADTKKIAEAILLYKRDTGLWPAYDTVGAAQTSYTPDKDCLVTGTSTAAISNGTFTCASGKVGLLSAYLNQSFGLTSNPNVGGG